jgi:hypothetical protein
MVVITQDIDEFFDLKQFVKALSGFGPSIAHVTQSYKHILIISEFGKRQTLHQGGITAVDITNYESPGS